MSLSVINFRHVYFIGFVYLEVCLIAFSSLILSRGIVEETSNNAEAGRNSVAFDRYIQTSKMQPQSSGSLRSNSGAEKGKEIAAKLNIHRVHGQLRGLDTTGIEQYLDVEMSVLIEASSYSWCSSFSLVAGVLLTWMKSYLHPELLQILEKEVWDELLFH